MKFFSVPVIGIIIISLFGVGVIASNDLPVPTWTEVTNTITF